MEILVERVNVGKTKKGTDRTGLLADSKWYNIFGAHPEYMGKKLKLNPGKFEGWYDVEFVVDQEPGHANGTSETEGKLEWKQYALLAREAHKLAKELEPDGHDIVGESSNLIDRSQARIRFVNTACMALKDGKLWLDDDLPF